MSYGAPKYLFGVFLVRDARRITRRVNFSPMTAAPRQRRVGEALAEGVQPGARGGRKAPTCCMPP